MDKIILTSIITKEDQQPVSTPATVPLTKDLEAQKQKKISNSPYTANIFEVFFTVFNCVPISTVVSLYGLHLIAAPSTVE